MSKPTSTNTDTNTDTSTDTSKPFAAEGINAINKYNPHLWGPEALKAIFVVRQKELAQLTEAIGNAEPNQAPQHLLLIGQRGMGKTTLLQRIALQVEEDQRLSQDWLPLRFPEEQYTVSTLAELWGNVLGALADALEAKQQPTALIDEHLLVLETLPDDEREQQTLALINNWCEQNHKRLLLLIDSTDLIFDNLSGKKGQKSPMLWRLRNTLQNNPNLLWLGGSYQALESSDLYHDAFLDFFSLIKLKPLTLDEITTAMKALARTFGTGRGIQGEAAEQAITQALTARPERLKTLRALTGGIPRTTVMLYELFAAGGSDQVKDDLARLLDIMTPLYKARLETLPEQQRKLMAHIMEYWQPMSLAQLAKVSGLINTQISPQLQRLEKEGLIEKTPLPNTTRAGYQVAERFFNIWYLMRNAPRRLKLRLAWLVEFMRLWYQPMELEQIAQQRLRHHGQPYKRLKHRQSGFDDLEYSRAIGSAMPCDNPTRRALDYEVYQQLKAQKVQKAQLDDYFDFTGDDKPFKSIEDYEARVIALAAKIRALPFVAEQAKDTDFCRRLLISMQYSLDEKEQMVEQMDKKKFKSIAAFLVDEYKNYEPADIEQFSNLVLNHKIQLDLPEPSIALLQLNAVVEKCPAFFWPLANRFWQLFHDEGLDPLILLALEHNAAQLNLVNFVDFTDLIIEHHDKPNIKKHCLVWINNAIETCCKSAIAYNLGVFLSSHLSEYEQAEKAYLKAIELDDKFAYPWNRLGYLYIHHSKKFEQAESAYLKAIELDEKFAYPWFNLGNLYKNHLNQYEQAEKAYLKAIELDEKDAGPWHNLGNLYKNHLNQYEQAEKAYLKAIELDEKFAYPWNNLGNLYKNHLNQYEQAKKAYLKAIELDEKNAGSWNNLGTLYQDHLNQYEQAEKAYLKAIELDEKYTAPWNSLGELYLCHLGKLDKAKDAYLKAIDLDNENPYVHCNLARLYAIQNQPTRATEKFKHAVSLDQIEKEPNPQLQCHLWLKNRGLANDALSEMASVAATGDNLDFFKIKEQCWECQQLGIGLDLADLMASNNFAEFLRPFELALRKVNGDSQSIKGAAVEVQQLAEEIVTAIEQRLITIK